MRIPLPGLAVLAISLCTAGCSSLPLDHGHAQTRQLVTTSLGYAPAYASPSTDPAASPQPSAAPSAAPAEPLDADGALNIALTRSPRIRETFARLGFGQAEIDDARRLANPTFGYARLSPGSAAGTQITRSVGFSIGDLLLVSARQRMAADAFAQLQLQVAHAVREIANEVEIAWLNAASASQVAAVRGILAEAAETSARMAHRFHAAGNISRLQLAREQAAAAEARIAAVRASTDALRLRFELASMIGLAADAEWSLLERLPAPPAIDLDSANLQRIALDQHLELRAARAALTLRQDAVRLTSRWRWLGAVDFGYERESELDGGVMRGPSLSLQLPIFNQGQAALTRAEAERTQAEATVDALTLRVRNSVDLQVQRVRLAQEIAHRYRDALLPQREAIVEHGQKELNYMLIGVFELLAAKQSEYTAYQEYLEAVRDYWLARAALRHAVGARLRVDDMPIEPTVGLDAILPAASTTPSHDGHHGHHNHGDHP